MKRPPFLLILMALTIPFAANASTGEELYMKHCKKCHGSTGMGDTPMGEKLEIRDYSSAEVQDSFTDEAARESIINGKKSESGRLLMFSFGKKLSEEEINLLVAHFRSLKAD